MAKKLLTMAFAAVGLVLVLVGGLFMFARFFFGRGRSGWFAAWRDLSKQYGAVVDSAWWLPRMRFGWREAPVELRSHRRLENSRGSGTTLESGAPEWPGFLLIESRTWMSRGAIHAHSTADGKRSLEDAFSISSSNGESPPALSEAVRWQIHELAVWSGALPLQIRAQAGKIRISRTGFLRTRAELDDFLRLGLRVIDQLRTMETQGLQFVNELQANSLEDSACPICSDKIGGRMVLCVRCKTPHCRECWDYNGKCGMFACNETRCART